MTALGGIVATVLVGGLVVAAPASAAPSKVLIGACTSSSSTRTSDPYSHTFFMRRYCQTATAPVYTSTDYHQLKGTLNGGNDWFLCYVIGYLNSGPYGSSNYWYYTHGDSYDSSVGAHNSWGFVGSGWLDALDANITSGMPQCTFDTVPL
jgi:hypothetical protein